MKHTEMLEYVRNNLHRDDISPLQQDLYDFLGAERYIEFCDQFGGMNAFYVNKMETLRTAIAKRKILEDKDLYESKCISTKQLAMMHDVSISTVYNILKGYSQ